MGSTQACGCVPPWSRSVRCGRGTRQALRRVDTTKRGGSGGASGGRCEGSIVGDVGGLRPRGRAWVRFMSQSDPLL